MMLTQGKGSRKDPTTLREGARIWDNGGQPKIQKYPILSSLRLEQDRGQSLYLET